MTQLPPTWSMRSLGDLALDEPGSITDGPFGSKLTSAHYSISGARVIRLQNIGYGDFRRADAFIPLSYFETLRKHEVREGDLLVASLGDDPPRSCLVPAGLGPAIVKADCIRIRLSPDVDPSWVAYALQSPLVKSAARTQMHGVGRLRLGLTGVRSLPVPIPPIDDQQRIVELLDDNFSRLDAADRYLSAAEMRVQSWYSSMVECEFRQFAARPTPIGELLGAPMRNGHSARASTTGAGTRCLTLSAVTHGEFTDQFTKIVDVPAQRVKDLWLHAGDVLVQRSNTPQLVGTTAMYEGPDDWSIFPDLLIRLRPNPSVMNPGFLTLAMRRPAAHHFLRSAAKGLSGSMPKIDQPTIASLQVPVPSLEDQLRVLSKVGEAAGNRERLAKQTARGQVRIKALRRGLLDAAFTGRLTGKSLDMEIVEELADSRGAMA